MFRRLLALLCASTILGIAATTGAPYERAAADLRQTTPPIVQVQNSVDPTGSVDVTAQLREAIASVPAGGTLKLAHGARYLVEGTLRIKQREGFTLDGNGATITATTPRSVGDSHIWVYGGSDIAIRDLKIVGANPDAGIGEAAYHEDHETVHGIRANGTAGLEIDRVSVTDVFGDFLYVGRDDDKNWSSDVWVHDSTFARNGRQGLAFTAVRRVVVERNTISQTRRSTIDLEPNTPSWGVEDVQIIDNTIGPGRLRFIASHGGGPVTNVVIARNKLEGHVLSVDIKPPDLDRRAGVWVVENTSDTEAAPPIKIIRVDGVVVRDNVQPVRAGGVAVDLRGVCGDLVTGNEVEPSTTEVKRKGPVCGTAPDAQPPPPPVIAARVEALTNPTTTRPPPTTRPTTSLPSPSTAPATDRDQDSDGGDPVALWAFAAAVLLVGTIVVIRRRRSGAPSDDDLDAGGDDPERPQSTSDANPSS